MSKLSRRGLQAGLRDEMSEWRAQGCEQKNRRSLCIRVRSNCQDQIHTGACDAIAQPSPTTMLSSAFLLHFLRPVVTDSQRNRHACSTDSPRMNVHTRASTFRRSVGKSITTTAPRFKPVLTDMQEMQRGNSQKDTVIHRPSFRPPS